MAEIKWIKITTDIFDDEKILLIESMPEADSIIVIWFKLLALAGKTNNSGVFMLSEKIPYTDEMFSTIFRRPINTVRLALSTFERFGMIEYLDGVPTIPNWEKHQNIDGLERIKEQNKNRKRLQREKQKLALLQEGCHVTSRDSHATDKDKEEDKNKNRDYIEDNPSPTKRFSPPSLDEVQAYCKERKNNVDPERFIDFYASKGWKVGNTGMKDWKAAVRTWEKREDGNNAKNRGSASEYPEIGTYL